MESIVQALSGARGGTLSLHYKDDNGQLSADAIRDNAVTFQNGLKTALRTRCREYRGCRLFKEVDIIPSTPGVNRQIVVWWPTGQSSEYRIQTLDTSKSFRISDILGDGLRPSEVSGIILLDGYSSLGSGNNSAMESMMRDKFYKDGDFNADGVRVDRRALDAALDQRVVPGASLRDERRVTFRDTPSEAEPLPEPMGGDRGTWTTFRVSSAASPIGLWRRNHRFGRPSRR